MKKRKPSVKLLDTENNLNFRFIWLGQTVCKYQVPLDIFNTINGIYDTNMLPPYILSWFESVFKHYLKFNNISLYELHLNSIWINEMTAGEYNPIHIHQGTLYTGLSSVMMLKLPKDMGPEYAREDVPMNGHLQIIGSANGQFVKSDYSPNTEERDFYIFPYDMRHCVYPHTNPNATRRTLAANMDVDYNPVTTRTAG